MLITNKIPASLESAFTNDGIECAPEVLQQPEWSFQSSATTNIVLKLLASGEKLTKVVSRQIYTGVKTGANDAFVINQSVYERIVSLDNSSLGLIKRMAQGEDLRPWYQDDDAKWMIVIPTGFTSSVLGKQLNEDEAWVAFVQQYPGVAQHLDKVRHLAVNRGGSPQPEDGKRPQFYAKDPANMLMRVQSNSVRLGSPAQEMRVRGPVIATRALGYRAHARPWLP